jgi:hypothetical protein
MRRRGEQRHRADVRYRAGAMIGRDLADLIIPPEYREEHRRGLRRCVRTGEARVLDHPLELTGQRADGSRFPVEVAITRPALDGPPLFTGYRATSPSASASSWSATAPGRKRPVLFMSTSRRSSTACAAWRS